VRAGYSNRPDKRCKGRSDGPVENPSEAPPPHRFVPPSPADRARRLTALRAALADAAPLFQARVRRDRQEGRS
jgi:hypothetical protein